MRQAATDPAKGVGEATDWVWDTIPPTSQARYISGGSALNIPDAGNRGSGDWHRAGWQSRRGAGTGARQAAMSDDTGRSPAARRIHASVLGTQRVIDVRPGLRRLGHPQAGSESVIWGASHERATAEYVIDACTRHFEPDPDHPEGILDRRTAHRWLATDDQDAWVRAVLAAAATMLPAVRRAALEHWLRYVFDDAAPTAPA